MKSLKKQRRIQIIALAAGALAASSGLIWYASQDAFQFFRAPSEVISAPPPANEVFRIGGLVSEGSLRRGEGAEISFSVTDGGATVPVVYSGILPDLFREGEGMVGTGSYVNGQFVATEILARHDETYMPAEVIDALKEQGVYVAPET